MLGGGAAPMAEPRTACRVCRVEILATTAEWTGGLCVPCHRAAHPIRYEVTAEDEARFRAIDEIRRRVLAGCSAEEFAAMRCPVCRSLLGLDSHPRPGRAALVFVHCTASSGHVGFTDRCEVAPAWWAAHQSGGWLIDDT